MKKRRERERESERERERRRRDRNNVLKHFSRFGLVVGHLKWFKNKRKKKDRKKSKKVEKGRKRSKKVEKGRKNINRRHLTLVVGEKKGKD